MNSALMSSVKMDWNTPANVIKWIKSGWPDGVDLDPCSNATSIVGAKKTYTIEDDGLSQSWDVPYEGLIYVNPPYGNDLPKWIDKALQETRWDRTMVLLVPARTDTLWWHKLVKHAHSVIFIKGRLRFLGASSSAPFPSALVVFNSQYGSRVSQFLWKCREEGAWVVKQ